MRRIWLILPCLLWTAPAWAQEEQDPDFVPSGVRIGLLYEEAYRPRLAVEPLLAFSPEGERDAEEVHSILNRDLDFSDRFEMVDVEHRMTAGSGVDYARWNTMGVDYLTTGDLRWTGEEYELQVTLHDVVYSTTNQTRSFSIPDRQSADFRMAVHAVADEIVTWATGQPGMAASRIAFIRVNRDGSRDLMLVDADGENLQRVASGGQNVLLSPAWSPDGARLAYTVGTESTWELHELDLRTGDARVVSDQPGLHLTPSYSRDGNRIAFGLTTTGGHDVHEIDLEDGSVRRITRGPRSDMSPSYSPDGRRMAFNSDRLGQAHIYIMPVDGDEATLLTRFVYGEPGQYNAPSWSPNGSLVAFHGRSRGAFQIMVADADRPGATVQQITADGRSEDPSWAPDGRHIVFSGWRPAGDGLYIVDTATGRLRPLVLGGRYPVPDWSPTLVHSSATDVRDR